MGTSLHNRARTRFACFLAYNMSDKFTDVFPHGGLIIAHSEELEMGVLYTKIIALNASVCLIDEVI